jgi:hypothetical protein
MCTDFAIAVSERFLASASDFARAPRPRSAGERVAGASGWVHHPTNFNRA